MKSSKTLRTILILGVVFLVMPPLVIGISGKLLNEIMGVSGEEHIESSQISAKETFENDMGLLVGIVEKEERNNTSLAREPRKVSPGRKGERLVKEGRSFLEGGEAPLDKIKAFSLFLEAAKEGNVQAQRELDKLCKKSPWACK